jgi:hypothetical protein
MKLLIEVIAFLVIGAIVVSIAIVVLGRNPLKLAQGELRCEGGGAIIINIGGKDFAVLEALKRHRTGGEQKVTVEHVHVHGGGQAIVGHVEHRGEGGAKNNGSSPCKAA